MIVYLLFYMIFGNKILISVILILINFLWVEMVLVWLTLELHYYNLPMKMQFLKCIALNVIIQVENMLISLDICIFNLEKSKASLTQKWLDNLEVPCRQRCNECSYKLTYQIDYKEAP